MKTASLTSGSVGGAFLRLTAPLIVVNILQQFYNTVDALVVGRFVGENEFAAVGIASSAMNLFLFALLFITVFDWGIFGAAGATFVAQYAAAVALATGIGWTAVNVFWLVKYLRSQRETESAKM